jgi:hypothetical protein
MIQPRHQWWAGTVVVAVCLVWVFTGACSSGGRVHEEKWGSTVLFMGDQAKIDRMAEGVRSGKIRLEPEWIEDTRRLRGDVLLRTKYGKGMAQLGVETISDFFTCLLQFRVGVTTREILEKMQPDLVPACDPETCDVCTSWTYPLDPRVRKAVIQYWLDWLRESSLRQESADLPGLQR